MKLTFLLFVLLFSQAGCVGPIYYVEGSTVLENDVAGDWPDFERQLRKKLKKDGATFYESEDSSEGRKRALNNINGEMNLNE